MNDNKITRGVLCALTQETMHLRATEIMEFCQGFCRGMYLNTTLLRSKVRNVLIELVRLKVIEFNGEGYKINNLDV